MCGIVGLTQKNKKLLLKMLLLTKHRGPDEKAIYCDENIMTGMNRLSIIDLRKNLYPFKYKHYILFYNGEIYNFLDLKKLLQKKGIKFKTTSDAEVILPLFDLYGIKAFSMLDGMFAIFIYDQKNKLIYLARDKFGEKPLYYFHQGSNFLFCSELKAIIKALNNQQLAISNQQLNNYFFQGHNLAPKTIINNINKVPPASLLTYDLKNHHIKLVKYCHSEKRSDAGIFRDCHGLWPRNDVDKRAHIINDEMRLINELDILIKHAVKSRLIADVPVGTFLSGGVDSSLITYFASKNISDLHTYSISFPEFKDYDEAKWAKIASELCKTKHTEISCTADKVRKVINSIGKFIDEPIVDAACLPVYLLAQEASKKLKVVLTGEGADETFAGYERYAYELILSRKLNLIKMFSMFLPLIKYVMPKYYKRLKYALSKEYIPSLVWEPEKISSLLKKKANIASPFVQKNKDRLRFMQTSDLEGFLPEQLLMKVDKMTMLHSLEARCPYLDPKLVLFGLNLDKKYKIRGLSGKYLLKKVAEKYLPYNLVWRRKHYFSVPLGYWFRNQLKDIVYDTAKELKKYNNLIDNKYFNWIIQEHMDKKADYNNEIWSIIVLIKFLKYYYL